MPEKHNYRRGYVLFVLSVVTLQRVEINLTQRSDDADVAK